MAMDLSLTIDNRLIIVLERKSSGTIKYIKLESNEVENLFFYLVKHRIDMFKKIGDEELKSQILNILVQPSELKVE